MPNHAMNSVLVLQLGYKDGHIPPHNEESLSILSSCNALRVALAHAEDI